MFMVASLCLSVYNALTFASVDLESLFFWFAGTSSESSGQVRISRSQELKCVCHVRLKGSLDSGN